MNLGPNFVTWYRFHNIVVRWGVQYETSTAGLTQALISNLTLTLAMDKEIPISLASHVAKKFFATIHYSLYFKFNQKSSKNCSPYNFWAENFEAPDEFSWLWQLAFIVFDHHILIIQVLIIIRRTSN